VLGDFEPGDPVDYATESCIRRDPDVHWLGYVPQPQPYYELMDIFVFPTRREGLGRVLLEAAAAGRPVVSTAATGVIDVVQDGLTGILVGVGDVDALTDATAKLLDDPALAARMGETARALVAEHFDNAIYLERLGRVLEAHAQPSTRPVVPEIAGSGFTETSPES
jgi:glycosyltransferase involved in cell wall biosynthesis